MNDFIEQPVSGDKLILRQLQQGDGAALHSLVATCPPLDLNSCYSYLLLCLHHAKTSVVAEIDGVLVGAVTGYIPPGQPDSLFIWQVAVAPQLRGQGLARLMLEYLRRTCVSENKLLWIETTISPSNTASHHLFTSFTLQHDVGCAITTLFPAEMFGESGHEEEKLYRIGPWDRSR